MFSLVQNQRLVPCNITKMPIIRKYGIYLAISASHQLDWSLVLFQAQFKLFALTFNLLQPLHSKWDELESWKLQATCVRVSLLTYLEISSLGKAILMLF